MKHAVEIVPCTIFSKHKLIQRYKYVAKLLKFCGFPNNNVLRVLSWLCKKYVTSKYLRSCCGYRKILWIFTFHAKMYKIVSQRDIRARFLQQPIVKPIKTIYTRKKLDIRSSHVANNWRILLFLHQKAAVTLNLLKTQDWLLFKVSIFSEFLSLLIILKLMYINFISQKIIFVQQLLIFFISKFKKFYYVISFMRLLCAKVAVLFMRKIFFKRQLLQISF